MDLPKKLIESIEETISVYEQISQLEGLSASEISPEYGVPKWVTTMCAQIKSELVPKSPHGEDLTLPVLVYVYKEHERLMHLDNKPLFMEVDSLAQMYVRAALDPVAFNHLIQQKDKDDF